MNSHKKIVITGAAGFLGSHLVERWRDDEQYSVYALTSKPDELREKLGGENVTYLYKDVLNAEMMMDAFVVNCAYPRNSMGTAIADGLKYIQTMFEAAIKFKAAAIINISSQSVYSQQRKEAATEETPVCLESPYAVGKYAVELMLESICRGRKIAYTNLRMASLIGPGFDQRLVNKLVKKLLNHESITIVRQNRKMGFLDVEDAVTAVTSIIDYSKKSWKTIYNIGNGQGYTVEEIYDAVTSILGYEPNTNDVIIKLGTDDSSTVVLFEKLNADTGFIPSLDLRESIKKIVAHL